MRCTFLANCGLLLEHGGQSILVDAPNGLHTLFDGVSAEDHRKMVTGQSPYDGLCGIFFTHRHSDHYDKKRVREITDARREVPSYAPNGLTPKEGVVHAGVFTVRYFDIGHSGAEFSEVVHRVLLVEAGNSRVYITGDAQWDDPKHLEIINGFSPTAATWNPNYLSHEEGRALMGFVKQNYLYHLPVIADDSLGFGRKCRHDYLRYGDCVNAVLVDTYPKTVEV